MKKDKNKSAQALANRRWIGTTKEQRKEATRKATEARAASLLAASVAKEERRGEGSG